MNTDIRIAVSFKGNRKRKKFRMLLGDQSATDYLLDFWISVATDKPSGDLSGLDNLDICLMAGWEGDCDIFVNALYEAGFLDKIEGGHKVHQWEEHNGYASAAAARSDKSRKAAVARWKARGVDSQAMHNGCSSIAQALPEVQTSNAPIPIPIPIPINIKDSLSDDCIRLAETLAGIVRTKKNINIQPAKIKAWARSISQMGKIDGIATERIDKALSWYEKNIGGEYVPVIESGSSLREKFTKLENAVKKSSKGNWA